MTEDEAKTKWCPFVRLICDMPDGITFSPTFNRMAKSDDSTTTRVPYTANCIGSECMAWRWNQSPNSNAERQQQASDPLGQLRGPQGYCGLAGKPQ